MNQNPLMIREGQADDFHAMSELLEQLFSIETDFEIDYQKQQRGLELLLSSKESVVLVAESDDQLIGMVTMQVLISTVVGGRVGLIEDMVVHQAYRNQGVGSKLLAAMEHKASQLGLARLQLLADKYNHQALDFYQKNKWQSTNMICLRKMNE